MEYNLIININYAQIMQKGSKSYYFPSMLYTCRQSQDPNSQTLFVRNDRHLLHK